VKNYENETKTNDYNIVLLRNREIHGKFPVIPSSENRLVAVMVVAILIIVYGRRGLWPSLWNPIGMS